MSYYFLILNINLIRKLFHAQRNFIEITKLVIFIYVKYLVSFSFKFYLTPKFTF